MTTSSSVSIGLSVLILACFFTCGCLDEPKIHVLPPPVAEMDATLPTPAPETCNGRDDDLDDRVDEGLIAPPAALSVGVCAGAMQVCEGVDGWQAPDHNAGPDYQSQEARCDGLDNDCDGRTDETTEQACGVTLGVCREGVRQCVDGQYEPCLGGVTPTDELCDGLDNDCDEATDETDCQCSIGDARACGLDQGQCVPGTQSCIDGQWSTCVDLVGPVAELCNGADDDCDGVTDEGNPEAGILCETGEQGLCGPGTTRCNAGALQCTAMANPADPVCGDEIDQDCDGDADEFRNACNTCGDQYEAGVACRQCFDLRPMHAPQTLVAIAGTIDTPDDQDFYCAYFSDNLRAIGETLTLSLSNQTPMGSESSFRVDLYRDEDACRLDNPLLTITTVAGSSRVAYFTEPRNDLVQPPIDDSGRYLIRVTADDGYCEDPYLLRVGIFD